MGDGVDDEMADAGALCHVLRRPGGNPGDRGRPRSGWATVLPDHLRRRRSIHERRVLHARSFDRAERRGWGTAGPDHVTGLGYSKRILPGFGLELDEEFQWLYTAGEGTASGFGNLEATLKYQFLTSAAHETILSVGISDEIGGTGSSQVGSESFSTISPTFFFGKGLGDLPDSLRFLRPLAITGVVGPSFPTRRTTQGTENPTTLTWAFTVQYSLMYLQSAVKDVGLGIPFNRLVTLVELPLQTCLNAGCGGQTSWTVNPGIAWIGMYVELGAAAEIPVNPSPGAGIGVFVLVHLFIDDLFPGSVGRPIFP